jgi:alpha-tubulin suppressor-like RCC1 family protein
LFVTVLAAISGCDPGDETRDAETGYADGGEADGEVENDGGDDGSAPDGSAEPLPLGDAGAADPGAVLTGVVALSAGRSHTCAILEDRSVACWSDSPPSGDEIIDGAYRVPDLEDVEQLAAGYDHTCALKRDGTVSCWGANATGQLGNGTTVDSDWPVQVEGIAAASSVGVGYGFSCAVEESGSAHCWGANTFATLGNGSYGPSATLPQPVRSLADASLITGESLGTCSVRMDGSLACWGNRFESREPVAVAAVDDVVDLAMGPTACVVAGDGRAFCMGDNEYGAVGNGTTEPTLDLVQVVGLDDATAIEVGWSAIDPTVCAITNSGAWCWGYRVGGDPILTPEPLSLQGVTAIAITANNACALLDDASVHCWDLIPFGDPFGAAVTPVRWMAEPSETEQPDPPIGEATNGVLRDAIAVDACASVGCALIDDGTVQCWTGPREEEIVERYEVEGIAGAVAISIHSYLGCARIDDGSLRCWTIDLTGVPIGPAEDTGLEDVISVATGGGHACAALANGDVYCWGDNYRHQAGPPGTMPNMPLPIPTKVDGVSDAVAVSAGDEHTCALIGDGSVMCWGATAAGQIGVGPDVPFASFHADPMVVPGINDAVAVSAGFEQTAVLLSDGTIRRWGRLGDGTMSDSPAAVLDVANAVQINVGERVLCAVLSDATVQCIGPGSAELGAGTDPPGDGSAAQVLGIYTAQQVAVGRNRSCAVLEDRTVQCWGYWTNAYTAWTVRSAP